MCASFRRVHAWAYMTVSEMLERMQENDLFDKFSEFPYVVHIHAVIPATLCYAERSHSALHRLKSYLTVKKQNKQGFSSPPASFLWAASLFFFLKS